MPINNYPAVLQPIIQGGYLETEFHRGLQSMLGFRDVADREVIPNNVGETVTKTRTGLLAPATTPLSPASMNTNFDNGMTPVGWNVEQYTLTMNAYGSTIDLNTVTERVGIAGRFTQNSYKQGVQAAQTLDRLCRDALYNAYLSGNTRVRTTLGSAGTAVNVDDVRGFLQVYSAIGGTPGANILTAVSSTNTMAVTIGANVYTLIGAAADGSNVSTAPNGVSGVLTFSTNVSTSDGTAGNSVIASTAASIFRPNARTNTSLLQATDVTTMSVLLDAKAQLESNGVQKINGAYNAYLEPRVQRELFADPDFRQLFQGAASSEVFRKGVVNDMLGLRFMPTTEAYQQVNPSNSALTVRRTIIVGEGALVEGDFAGQGATDTDTPLHEMYDVDGITHIVREPMDRLAQIVAQSWEWIGGFVAPSDVTTNSNIIPTASNAAYKRAIVIESV